MTEPTIFLPPPELREVIASYGILEIPGGRSEPYFSPPLAMSGFIINTTNSTGQIVSKLREDYFFSTNEVATGQVTYPVYGELIGHIKSIMVFFQPLGMYQLFGNDMAALTNTSQSLYEFLEANRAEALISSLKQSDRNEDQIQILNSFFKDQITRKFPVRKMKDVVEYIHINKGDISVADIENECHYQRKTLERHFTKMLGLSPKVYCQIYRFKCLINQLQQNPGITWTELADQAGYYDQAHMSRYIKKYLKVSPNSMVLLDMNFIYYLLSR
ncbi:helix-turn-helix domain-containing protein [Christiangramia fulva]|nr:AraC family transcriptional regulator [Christiangramia fulva]